VAPPVRRVQSKTGLPTEPVIVVSEVEVVIAVGLHEVIVVEVVTVGLQDVCVVVVDVVTVGL
jgi:hypothetical protein